MKQIFELKEVLNNIHEGSDVFNKIKKIQMDYSQENFLLFCLNTKNQVVKKQIVFKGSADGCLLDPKVIFRNALLSKAVKVIIAHNHPSGCLKPSNEDEDIYKRMKDAGEMIDIKVIDSIVFNKKEFYSMQANN